MDEAQGRCVTNWRKLKPGEALGAKRSREPDAGLGRPPGANPGAGRTARARDERGMVVHAASYQDEDDDDDEPTTLDIHDVTRKGQLKPLSKLLKHAKQYNIDVNAADERGRTPLMLACRHGHGKAVEYLMQAGASPDIKDNDGYAPVHFCVLASVDRLIGIGRAASGIRALAKYRAFLDRKTVDGFTAGEGRARPRSPTPHSPAPLPHGADAGDAHLLALPVHVAVKVRATDIVSQLKDFGCDIDKFSTDGVNAIYLACQTAAEDKTVTPVLSLMQLGARIDRVDPVFFRTALHKACDEELPEICRFLVLSKASVLIQDKYGDTPLHIVAKRGSCRTLEVICQALVGGDKVPADPGREKEDLEKKLEAISDQADEAKIKSIMSLPDSTGNTPLHIACSFGYESLVTMLLRQGADPEKKNFNSTKGVEGGSQVRPDKKSKRKKRAQDPEDEAKPVGSQGGGGKTPYHVVAEVGHTDIFKNFVRKGIDTSGVDENGHTCLHYAAMNNDVEIADIQMECDPNPNVQTLAGWTPLHYAAAYDSVHIIVFLLEARADPTLENHQGHTPIMLASRTRTKRALEGLLKDTLQREEMEREQRERAMMEERKRLMAEMENEVALRAQKKQPLLEAGHDSDEDKDEVRQHALTLSHKFSMAFVIHNAQLAAFAPAELSADCRSEIRCQRCKSASRMLERVRACMSN